jgi:hypothetical protein
LGGSCRGCCRTLSAGTTCWNTTSGAREYFDTGRITFFLPHNVFASFPQQVELLYLLLMHLAAGCSPPPFRRSCCMCWGWLCRAAAWTPDGRG